MKTEISFGLNLTDCTPKMPEMLMPEMLNTLLCVDRSYIQLWPKKKKKKKSHMSLREITRPSFQTSNRNMAAAVSLAWEHLARGPQIFSTRKSHVNKSL